MKKLITSFLLIILVIGILPVMVFADSDTGVRARTNDDVETTVNSNRNTEPVVISANIRTKKQIQIRNITLHTELNVTENQLREQNEFNVRLSNGKNAAVKIMPETASQTAIERLRLRNCNESNNCTIELKEVGEGNQTRAIYEVKARKKVKILGIFDAEMDVEAEIETENGEVIAERRPWWAFFVLDA